MLFVYPVSEMNLQLTWLNETKACTILQGNPFGKRMFKLKREIERERYYYSYLYQYLSVLRTF